MMAWRLSTMVSVKVRIGGRSVMIFDHVPVVIINDQMTIARVIGGD